MRERNRINLSIMTILALLPLISCATKSISTEPTLISTTMPLPQITPPPTISDVPTFSPEIAYLELENLLKNDCGLPCFAGITPGETLLVDASRTLFPFTGISNWTSLSEKGGQLGVNLPKEGLILNLFFQIDSLRDSNQVDLFRVSTEALWEIEQGNYQWVYDGEPYHEVFSAYSLQKVLATYGRPSEIFMTVEINEGEYNSPDFVLFWLLYPEKGFIAKYTSNADELDDVVYGCPSKTFVELWLFPPYETNSYKEELLTFDQELGYIFPIASPRTKTLSDGMGMTIEEFYQMFNQPTTQCLETPSSNWPNWWR
jgi:hypothetical protein